MEFGQMRQQNNLKALDMMYQGTSYSYERSERRTLLLDITDDATTKPLADASVFSQDLFEPLIIDALSDIYLDSFLSHNSLVCDTGNTMAFSMAINEFNINSNCSSSAAGQNIFNRIIIPNDHSSTTNVHSAVVHKGKKMNYICSINPCKLTKLTGKITDLNGSSMFTKGLSGSGKLNFVELSGTLSASVAAGSTVTFASGTGGTGSFITAFFIELGSTDLYFYENGGTITGADLGNATVNSLSVVDTVDGTLREGDFPRMIAEFVIITR